jgi:hypothetical protein
VGRVGKTDGYNGDPSIRIPLPEPLQKIEGPLKAVGASGTLDDLQVKMNRAAEQAAPKALGIFTDAASKMSIDDARAILNGPQDSATQYFKRTTSTSLTTSFHPIVDKELSSVGAVNAFKATQAKAAAIPMAGQEVQSFNLTDFTVGKALDGLFHYLAVEEADIRTNPAARTTDLLKKVFSSNLFPPPRARATGCAALADKGTTSCRSSRRKTKRSRYRWTAWRGWRSACTSSVAPVGAIIMSPRR